jgi:hypothetical protein
MNLAMGDVCGGRQGWKELRIRKANRLLTVEPARNTNRVLFNIPHAIIVRPAKSWVVV